MCPRSPTATSGCSGLDPAADGPEIRSRLGVVAQDDNLDSELTVFDNLIVYGRYFDLPRREISARAEELLGVRPAHRPS